MTKIDDGGQAFPPNAGWRDDDPSARGMSLRDWFAGMALNQRRMIQTGVWYACDAAREAYEIADALIAEKRRTEASPAARPRSESETRGDD